MKIKEMIMGRKKKVVEPEVVAEAVVEVPQETVVKKAGWVESLPSNVTTNVDVDANDPRTRSDR